LSKSILITGAYGFIGNTLCKNFLLKKYFVNGSVRYIKKSLNIENVNYIGLGEINYKTNWGKILKNQDCVIHCAGKSNSARKRNQQGHIYETNVDGTKKLAESAAEAGVRRLIFLSSIKVNGEKNIFINHSKTFTNEDRPNPIDNYAKSKLKAENILLEISAKTGLEVVIIRLPLVYGYGAKGNLAKLIKLVRSRIPLPLSLIKNQRSMIGMDNLVDFLNRCIDHQEASGKIFLASDGKDLSTPELIKLIASSMGIKPNLFPFPLSALKFLGSIFGQREEINRLTGSLKIDNNYTKEILNWTPPLSVEEGIRRMVQLK